MLRLKIIFLAMFGIAMPLANAEYIKSSAMVINCASAQDVLEGSIKENYRSGICLGLLTGMLWVNELDHVSKDGRYSFCPPSHNVDLGMITELNEYIQKHGLTSINGHGVALLHLSLVKTFPCEESEGE